MKYQIGYRYRPDTCVQKSVICILVSFIIGATLPETLVYSPENKTDQSSGLMDHFVY